MKKLLPLVTILSACTPDIEKTPPPPQAVVVEFEPGAAVPVVPTPNDLAINPATKKIVVPARPGESAAQREFEEQYLGTLDGYPQESTAKAFITGGALVPESVNPQTVIGFDTTAVPPAAVPLAPQLVDGAIVVSPPPGGWLRAHRYAIAVIGGPNGVKGTNGQAVVGSATWALVSSPAPLVTCTDLTSPNCAPTVDIIPSSESDPTARVRDQTQKAIQLEQIRRGYAPLLDALAARGIPREDVPLLWTFTIVDAGEVTFDPGSGVIPFPNDVVRANGKVNVPNPKTGLPLTAEDCAGSDPQIQLACGLNTLDGFSTIAPPISENSNDRGAVAQANIDPRSLAPNDVGLVPLVSSAPEPTRTIPKFTPCIGCLSSTDANGTPQTGPQQLQWRLDAPLDERTTYLAYVTGGVKDDAGKPVIANPIFALVRGASPLVENGKSTVDVLTDEQAARLEPLRAALAPALDGLQAQGIPRSTLALAFAFTTQSEGTLLDQLYGYPGQVPGLPDTPFGVNDATAMYTAAAGTLGIPLAGVGKIFEGTYLTPVAITGPGGTLDVNAPKVLPVAMSIALPSAAAPPAGYPVVVFGHGFGRWHRDFLPIASAIASTGRAVIAADTLFHGERTSCTGSKAATAQPTDDAACANPTTMRCDEGAPQGLCVLRDDAARAACTVGPQGDVTCAAAGQGRCAADAKCQGGGADFARDASGRPNISGWNIFSLTNFFATRDNFRQAVIDLSQLIRVLRGNAIKATAPLDTANIGYVGQSLGGILGTLFNGVSPDTSNVVLDVPGGALPLIILNGPSFAPQKQALLAGLAQQGIQPGTPAFDTFIATAQWIVDPADPANLGYRLTHPTAPNPNRKAFIQFIEGDQTVPNISTFALVSGANRDFAPTPPAFGCKAPLFCYEFTEAGDGFNATTATPQTRHGFLLSPPQGAQGPALTAKAQTQAATFLSTGALP